MKIGKSDLSYIVAAAVGVAALIALFIFGSIIHPRFSSSGGSGENRIQIVSDGAFGDIVFNELLLSNDNNID